MWKKSVNFRVFACYKYWFAVFRELNVQLAEWKLIWKIFLEDILVVSWVILLWMVWGLAGESGWWHGRWVKMQLHNIFMVYRKNKCSNLVIFGSFSKHDEKIFISHTLWL